MHSSLTELLENLRSGQRGSRAEGGVRSVRAAARQPHQPDLARAGAGLPPAHDASFDAGSAYDKLMQVIRADLRDPLREAHAALELARQGVDGAETDPVADGVAGLVRVLDRLVDLAELWSHGALSASDRIELWPMLQSVWAGIQPIAAARSVSLRFQAQGDVANLATLYGSEAWLRRLFLECLEAAVRGRRPGSTLEIEHRQLGPRVEIVLLDCEVFTDRRPRDEIGHRLCQRIVSLHGGQLREEHEDGRRHFVIDLPTGAPHHVEDTHLDIAQAQRYARDLAALMARTRQRAGETH